MKKFLEWMRLKEKRHESEHKPPHVSEGDIWWASLGENVGSEINGKSHQFSRPVIIFKKLAHGFYFVIPTTTKTRNGSWYCKFHQSEKEFFACLHQARSIDHRRLYSRLGELDDEDEKRVRIQFENLYTKKFPTVSDGVAGKSRMYPNSTGTPEEVKKNGYFVIIRGPLASGKSTLSNLLAKDINAKVVRIDTVLDNLNLNKVPEGEPNIPVKNFIKANDHILPEVQKDLESGRNIIFDACFYHKEVIEDVIKRLPFTHYIFTLKVPLETCIERDAERNRSYGEGAACAVHSFVSKFDYGINIDGSGDIESTVSLISAHLPK
jgi:mRNA interferase MazF